jgi:cytochrome d ubiquinol oxidase subunit I
MESLWETQRAAPFYLLLIPDPKNERNAVERFGIPYMLSLLARKDPHGEVTGLKSFPKEDRPPVMETFVSFRLMVGLGFLFLFLSALAAWLSWRDRIEACSLFLRILPYVIPLPYLAAQLGWVVAEVGRQPWIVYGVLKTQDAVSRGVDPSQVLFSLLGFFVFYSLLGAIDLYLLVKNARRGPETA